MSTPFRRSARLKTINSSIKTASMTTTSHDRPRKRSKAESGNNTSHSATSSVSQAKRNRVPKVKNAAHARVTNPASYAARVQTAWKIGAHVSAAGGVENSVLNAASIRANSFALFVKSQRKWSSAALTDESIQSFKSRLLEFDYSPDLVLPHGSYLINLGNPDSEKREKSYECFIDDLRRCELLGLTHYNFHPGSTVGAATKEESIGHIAACLNRAHKETKNVMTVIENMAGSGNVLGSKFEEIAEIINHVVDKSRVGVCLDTCHMFAAGYDIRTKEAYHNTISEFDRVVGLKYLRGMHINDSKTALASAKDRHENVGQGQISLATFGYIMRDERLQNIPLILETPTNEDSSVWEKEIEVLNALSTCVPEDTQQIAQLQEDIAKGVKNAAKGNGGRKVSKSGKRKRVKAENDDDVSESEP